MHILFLAHRPPFPPNKGEKIRTFNQLVYLKGLGYRVSVGAPVSDEEDIAHMETLGSQYCEIAACGKLMGKQRLLLALLKGQALSVGNFYSAELQAVVNELFWNGEIDAVICTSSSMAEYVFRALQSAPPDVKTPRLIMDFMDLDSDKWRQYQSYQHFPLSFVYAREARLVEQYEQRIHRQFDGCLFISQQEVDIFLSKEEDQGKVHVVANGIDLDYFQPVDLRESCDSPRLLFTGVMDYLPNSDAVEWFVNNCWMQIQARWPGAEFYIAGMNPTAKVQALSRHNGVHVTGFVEDIREYYNKCDIFVAPFRIARGVQNKVLQAFACGLPVISTPLGCEGIPCQHGEHVLQASEPEDFVDSLSSLVQDRGLRKQLRTNALELAQQRFSWSGCLEPLADIIGDAPSISEGER